MSKLKQNALIMASMAAMMSEGSSMMFSGSGEDEARVFIPKEPMPPKGTKQYFFNHLGEYSTERMLKTDTVFKCFSINDKNAIRKFNKFNK